MKHVRSAFDWIEKILKGIAVLLVVLMLIALAVQVFMRYVLAKPLSWSEELALLWFAWVVVISSAIGVRRMTHARMSLLVDSLPKRLHALADRLVALLLLGIGLFLAYAGWLYVQETRGSFSAAVRYPIEYLYLAAPVFGVLISLFAIERILPGARTLDE